MNRREFHPPHIHEADTCYFLSASVVDHQRILDTDVKRTMLRDILKMAIQDHNIRLYAWVILADHYHLLPKTGDSTPLWKFIKRLHGESAVQLNKLDRRLGRKVWYQYWDRFPRNERDFWPHFNYIHSKPIKHGYVRPADGTLEVTEEYLKINPDWIPDVHLCLSRYPYSSYGHYLRSYGQELLTDVWMQYPVLDHLEHDDF
jgi:REP element-mobilizing transposase RayT